MKPNQKKRVRKAKDKSGFEKLRRKNSVRLARQRMFYGILILLLLLIFSVTAIALFFRVHTITVRGNNFYEDNDIISASGIEEDVNIYLIDDKRVTTALLSAFPYIKTVNVDRDIPSTVTIDVKCDSPDYYTEIGGECFVLSGELRVLERFSSKHALLEKYPECIKLTIGDVKKGIVGSELVFVDEGDGNAGKSLLASLEQSEVYSGVSSVDLSDRFNIHIVYEKRLNVNVGNKDDLALKLRFMNEVIKDLGEAKGSVDMKNVDAAYVLLDSNAEFD